MPLEEKIKQTKPFRSEWERAMVNVMYASMWLNEQFREHLEAFDITQQQYNVLRILRGQSPNAISTSDIRERMIDRAPDTSRIVDRLVAKELVEKHVCEIDKRRVDVRITPKGLALLTDIDNNERKMDSFTRRLTKTEAQQLNSLLDKLTG